MAHSYGGIVAREFCELRGEEVVGAVFADSSTERQCHYFKIPDPNIAAVSQGVNFATATGLRADAKITRDEWRTRAAEMKKASAMTTTMAEAGAFVEVCETLGRKRQFERCVMGDRPVSVIRCNSARDYWRLYEAGVEMGKGTEEQKKGFRELLERWDRIDEELQREQLRLSRRTRYVHVGDCGHNVQLVRPDVIAEEIAWVLGNIGENRETVEVGM